MRSFALALAVIFALWPAAFAEAGRGEEAARRAEAFVDTLVDSRFEEAAAEFDERMTDAMPPAKLQQVWSSLVGQAGAFQERVVSRTEKAGGFQMGIVTCRFERAVLDVKVVYNADGRVGGLWFAPGHLPEDEAPPYVQKGAFDEVATEVSGAEEPPLPGTLSLPNTGALVAAVVLVHGSGPHDRDETVGANKPFRDLAWGLASRGIAVLRYEKRTMVDPGRFPSTGLFTVQEEVVEDVLAAVALLQQRDRVEPARVFVLGHSLGGTLVPRIAEQIPSAAGFIVLAGSPRPLDEVLRDQVEHLQSLAPDGGEAAALASVRAQAEQLRALRQSGDYEGRAVMGVPGCYLRDLNGYDPAKVASSMERPLLILHGGRDYQVTQEDFRRWRQALQDKANAELKLYPALNHLFIPGEGPSRPAEYLQPGHVAEEVVSDIADWIERASANAVEG